MKLRGSQLHQPVEGTRGWRCKRCGEKDPPLEERCPGRRAKRSPVVDADQAVADQLARAALT